MGLDIEREVKVAIVDSDQVWLDLNEAILQTAGYKVVRFDRHSDLYDRLILLRPDVIISNIVLNNSSSNEVLEQIKVNPSMKNIPLIIIGTYPNEHMKAIEIGACRFLSIPYHPDELLAAVKSSADGLSTRRLNS